MPLLGLGRSIGVSSDHVFSVVFADGGKNVAFSILVATECLNDAVRMSQQCRLNRTDGFAINESPEFFATSFPGQRSSRSGQRQPSYSVLLPHSSDPFLQEDSLLRTGPSICSGSRSAVDHVFRGPVTEPSCPTMYPDLAAFPEHMSGPLAYWYRTGFQVGWR